MPYVPGKFSKQGSQVVVASSAGKDGRARLTVAINALAIPSIRQGGGPYYAGTLMEGLSHREELDVGALVSTTAAEDLRAFDFRGEVAVSSPAGDHRLRKVANLIASRRDLLRLNWGFDDAAGQRVLQRDIVQYPVSFLHGPRPPDHTRVVLTVLDIQQEFHPDFFQRRERIRRRMRWKRSCEIADHIIAASHFTKATLCDRYGIPDTRITTVHLTCRKVYWQASDSAPSNPLPNTEPSFLYPASPYPHKNHSRLLEAFKLYRSRVRGDPRLVLVGPHLHDYAPLTEKVRTLGLGRSVEVRGHVSDLDLHHLYRTSAGLVFPSLFEGFGLPVLEAMVVGCPVAVSDACSLPEIAGDVALVFEPTDVEAIAEAFDRLASLGATERAELVNRGRVHAQKFRPERMVEETIRVYRLLLDK